MKKTVFLGVLLFILVFSVGCSNKYMQKEVEIDTMNNTPEENSDIGEENKPNNEKNINKQRIKEKNEINKSEVLDLTEFNKTMAFVEIRNIYINPKDYIGRRVKVKGAFGCFQVHDKYSQPIPNKYQYLIVITDEMGCCGVGMEFLPTEEYTFPDDFPNDQEEIVISGTLEKVINDYGKEDIIVTSATIE